jgi:sugar transferase (PEP-CTERM/EpsH1 system associated)
MAPYAPASVPILLDMVDVDSEKWLQYARSRTPGFAYATEARRLRRLEAFWAIKAGLTVLTTENEAALLRRLAPEASIASMENGVDGEYFDGASRPLTPDERGHKFVAFVGSMDYPPNIEAALWFAERVLPELRRRDPSLEFFVIGRNPAKALLKAAKNGGMRITGGVPDIRPYLASARAIVTPLHLARGIQNKVLEALAMGRPVFASDAVCRTFGAALPAGVFRCAGEREFIENVSAACEREPARDDTIRAEACRRFSWPRNLESLAGHLDALLAAASPDGRPAQPAAARNT